MTSSTPTQPARPTQQLETESFGSLAGTSRPAPAGDVAEVPIRVGESYMRLAGVEHNVANHTAESVAFVEIELLEHSVSE